MVEIIWLTIFITAGFFFAWIVPKGKDEDTEHYISSMNEQIELQKEIIENQEKMVELYKNKEKTNKEMISNYKIITGRQTETVQKHKETIKGLKEMLREEREKNGETTKEDKGSGE